MCIVLYTKLSYIEKNHLSCHTTETIRKYSEFVKLPYCLALESQQKFVYGSFRK